jgi:hypothetical protein
VRVLFVGFFFVGFFFVGFFFVGFFFVGFFFVGFFFVGFFFVASASSTASARLSCSALRALCTARRSPG